jgi:hypothetical protein
VDATVGTHIATLLSEAGASSFLQLAELGKLRVTVGIATVEWPGATAVSNETEVSGLPGEALICKPFLIPVGNGFGWYPVVGALTAKRFKVTGVSTTGSPGAEVKGEAPFLVITD